MALVDNDKTILRFLYNQDIDSKKKFKRGKYIFFTWAYKHKNSVAIEDYKTYSEYKIIARKQESLPHRRFKGYAQLEVAFINNLGQSVEEAFNEFEGHAHIVYDSSFIIIDDEPLPNMLDDLLNTMQEKATYLLDKNDGDQNFDPEINVVDSENKRKVVLSE